MKFCKWVLKILGDLKNIPKIKSKHYCDPIDHLLLMKWKRERETCLADNIEDGGHSLTREEYKRRVMPWFEMKLDKPHLTTALESFHNCSVCYEPTLLYCFICRKCRDCCSCCSLDHGRTSTVAPEELTRYYQPLIDSIDRRSAKIIGDVIKEEVDGRKAKEEHNGQVSKRVSRIKEVDDPGGQTDDSDEQ